MRKRRAIVRITLTHCAPLAVLASLFACGRAAQAQQAIAIKVKERSQGETFAFTQKATRTVNMKIADATGKILQEAKESKTEFTAYTETILKCRPGEVPTTRERQYGKWKRCRTEKR